MKRNTDLSYGEEAKAPDAEVRVRTGAGWGQVEYLQKECGESAPVP